MRAFPSDVELPKVEIHVTDVCNNRCGFCTTGWVNAEQGPRLAHVPREVIRAQLETAHARGARRALFQGGEPTVRRDLGDLLRDAHDVGYHTTTIFTNARMAASRAGARWLAAMDVTWFQVSIQGGTAEAHDASVGAPGAFEQTVAGTRRLLALGQRVKINAVLTRHLLGTLPAFADLMIDLAPEEVGLDTVKPSAAFEEARATFADLVPALGPHRETIRDAVLAMDAAGLTARLTSFPPCLAPGAEHLVSEEAPTTLTHQTSGLSVNKLLWKRTLQRKAEACAQCAYDTTCGGVYAPYADHHGLTELHPLTTRKHPAPPADRAAPDTPLTRVLRALLVRPTTRQTTADRRPPPTMQVRRVRRLTTGDHMLDCLGPRGETHIALRPLSTVAEAAPRAEAAPPVESARRTEAAPPIEAAPRTEAAPPVESARRTEAAPPIEAAPRTEAARRTDEAPPYATTERFTVFYRNERHTSASLDLTLVDAVVRTLRRIEPRLPPDAP